MLWLDLPKKYELCGIAIKIGVFISGLIKFMSGVILFARDGDIFNFFFQTFDGFGLIF